MFRKIGIGLDELLHSNECFRILFSYHQWLNFRAREFLQFFFHLGCRFFLRDGFLALFDESSFVFFVEFTDFFDHVSVAAIDQLSIEGFQPFDEKSRLFSISFGGICFGKCFVALGANGHQFIEMSHIFFWSAGLVSSFSVWLTSGIAEKNRGEALHLVFLLQGFVLLLEFGIQFLLLWKVQLNEHELVLSAFFEWRMVEYFFVKLNAPTTPIRASKVDQEVFFSFGCRFFSDLEVSHPAFARCKSASECSKT